MPWVPLWSTSGFGRRDNLHCTKRAVTSRFLYLPDTAGGAASRDRSLLLSPYHWGDCRFRYSGVHLMNAHSKCSWFSVRGSKSLYIASRVSLCNSSILLSSVSCFPRSDQEVNVLTEVRSEVNLFTRVRNQCCVS